MCSYGSRNARNILLEHDDCLHESPEGSTRCNNQISAPTHSRRSCSQGVCNVPTPQSGSCSSRRSTRPEAYDRSNESHFKNLHEGRSATNACTPILGGDHPPMTKTCQSRSTRNPIGEFDGGESYVSPNEMPSKRSFPLNLNSIRATEYGEQFLQPELKEVSEGRKHYIQRFRNGMVSNDGGLQNDHHTRRDGIAAAMNNTSYKDSQAAHFDGQPKIAAKYADRAAADSTRNEPRGTPFSCNDCREPQCLSCWRKFHYAAGGAESSFFNGFETHEPQWKPGRRNVDLLGKYLKPNRGGFNRGTNVEDNVQACRQIRQEEVSACQSPCPQHEDPRWTPAHRITDSHDQESCCSISGRQERCNSSRKAEQISSQITKDSEWQWAQGKGRGMGPVPGEWVPPFRKYADDHASNQSLRGKGLGATPNLDDWVPPFRGEKEQPYNWHRCKGTGDCPPRDQWLAPWRRPKDNVRSNEICTGK